MKVESSWMNGIYILIKETPERFSCCSPAMWEHDEKMAVGEPGGESSQNPIILAPWFQTSSV